MLTLENRPVHLSGDFAGKVKDDNGEAVRTMTFKLEEIELDENELGAFFRDPLAYRQLYSQVGEAIEPFLNGRVRTLELKDEIKGALVILTVGLTRVSYQFGNCTLTAIKVHLRDGGKTKLSFKVTSVPFVEHVTGMFEYFDSTQDAEIRFEPPGAQAELPAMNTFGEGENPEGGGGKKKPRRGAKLN